MMGTILGVNGINIGHELGHKTKEKLKVFLGHIMLLTTIQNHFIPYHNAGHHRDVGTPNDLSSAKEGDIFYFFAIRSQVGGYFKAWRLEYERLKSSESKSYEFGTFLFLIGESSSSDTAAIAAAAATAAAIAPALKDPLASLEASSSEPADSGVSSATAFRLRPYAGTSNASK